MDKSSGGATRIDLAQDKINGNLIGYCVSTISKDNRGEIDSIFIEEDYRRSGIGAYLTEKALGWMDEKAADGIITEVIINNQDALNFYYQYGFYPRCIILERVKKAGLKRG